VQKKSSKFSHFSPFADPVVSAVFNSVETAGRAIQSLGNSVTECDGIVIADVISVTPQSYTKLPEFRGTRVDVKSKTSANQELICEVNMYANSSIHYRNFLTAANLIVNTSQEGTTAAEMARNVPQIIFINILDFIIRKDNPDWLQPSKFFYTKPPVNVAFPKINIYDIELRTWTKKTVHKNDSMLI
jgi:hypothetical protein